MSVFNWLRSPTRQRQQKRRQSAERRQRLSRYLSTIRPILGIERLESRVMLDAQGFDFPGRAYDVGDRPESVVAADVDGDGHIDLITANSVSNTVSVLRSLGDGTFATQVTYDVGHYPASIVAADINGDGHVDLITANRNSGTVSVLRNLENGIFAAQVTYAVGTNPRSVSVADIDGDGQIDLVTANHGSDTVSVLRNFGDGTFASQATYDVGRSPGAVVAADLDGNGRVDLVTANQSSGTVSVLRNIDDGTFASHVTYEIGGSEYGVANFTSLVAADLNGDGYIDLVARSNGSYTASVLTNFGDGTFASQVAYTVGGQGYYVTAADIDGDGHVDLVSTGAGGVYIMRNRADGTFASRVRYAMDGNFWSVTAADFDGDGHIDLAITAGTSFGVVFVLQNVGDGVLGSEDIYAEQRLHRYMTGADFNGDGYVDLVSIDLYGEITVLRNQGDGTFAPGGMHPGARAIHGSTTDVDGDGHIDLVTAGWNFIAVFRNLGDGTFELWSTYDVSEPAVFVEATDVDGDGRIDLVIVNNVGQLSVLRDIADGTFPTREPYTVGGTPRSVAVADIDGDGRVDLITTIDNDDSGILSILKNRGDGTFSSPVTYAVDKNPRSVTAADIDGDGHVDLITANYDSDTISVLRNSGNGTFAPQVTYDAGRFLWAVTVADLDGDGHIDLATLNQTNNFGTVSVLRNHGDGTFATEATYAVGSNTFSVVALDLDGDGYVDLATAGSSGVFVLRNQARPNGGGISNDLFVSVVSVQPDSVNLGQTVQVEYNVQNIGEQAAQGNWFDSIYLSRNTTFDSSDLLLDRVRHENGLESEQGYTRSVNVSIPAFAVFEPGDWHILVRTDSSNRVPESDKTNNLGVSSPITINQQVTTLALGETFVGEIAAGQSMYFQVDYTQNEPLAFRLDGLPANGIVELFVNRDGLPSRTYFDRTSRSPFVNSQYIYLPPQVEGGRFYVLIHAPTLMDFSTNFELTAWVPEFGVLTRSFGTAGNAGEFTLQAIGAAFDSTITARLINDKGNEFTSKSHHVDDPTRYYATFDMRDVPRGTYDVVFTNSVGMEVTVPQSLDVIIALENSPVVPRVIVPSAVRRGLPYSFIIEWENMSQNDAYAPILTVGNSVPFGTSRNDLNSLGTQHMFLGVNTQEGPAGILRPGQRERVTFWSYSDSEPGEHSIWVDRIDLTDEFDWDGVKLQMWPSYLSEEEFESIFQQLVDQVGRTWGDFQGMLSRNASLLPYPREQLREFSHSLVLAIDDLTALQRPSITGRLLGMVEDFAMPPVFAEHTVTKEHSKATIRIDGSFVFPAIEPGTYRLFVPSYELNGSPDVTIEVGGSELIGDLTISPSTLSIYQQLLNAGVDEEIATMIVSGDIFSEEFDFSAFSFDFGETHQRPGATSMLDAMAEVIARGTWESTVFSHGLLKATALEYWLRRWNLASYHLNSFLDAAGRDLNYVAGSTVSEMAKHDTVGYFNHREAAKKVEAAVRELAMKKLAMGELAPFSLSMEDLLRTAGLQSFPGPNFYKSPNDILPHNDLSAAFGDMGGSKRLGINHSVEVVVRNGVSVRGSGGDWRPIQWVASIRYLWEDDYSFWNDQAKSVFDRAGYYLENIVGSAKPFRTTIEIIESIHVGGPTPLFPYDGKSVYRPGSVDPNDIIGPAGYGTESHIVALATM